MKKLKIRQARPPVTFIADAAIAGVVAGFVVVGFGSDPSDGDEAATEVVLDNGVKVGIGATSGVVCVTADVVVDSAVVDSVAGISLVVVCGSGCAIEVVVGPGTRPPCSGGTAYGGSNSPNPPHALHGKAQDLTRSGATRIGSHLPSGAAVAITEAASV